MKRVTQRFLIDIDRRIIPLMQRLGHQTERYILTVVFVWFGFLKLFGEISATSIVAKSIYWIDSSLMVPALGIWEILIGFSLTNKKTLRLAILLLFVRVPGTLLAFVYHFQTCFDGYIWLPTIQGQYLIKELTLIGAALVIGSTIKISHNNTDEKF